MWAAAQRAKIDQQNRVNLIQLDMAVMNQQHSQLGNVILVATLTLGFVGALWNARIYSDFVKRDSEFCLLRNGYTEVLGFLFFITTSISFGLSLVVTAISALVKQLAYYTALECDAAATVAYTRELIGNIYIAMLTAALTFVIGKSCQQILYVAVPTHTDYDLTAAENKTYVETGTLPSGVLQLYDGTLLVKCMNMKDPQRVAEGRTYMLAVGYLSMAILIFTLLLGVCWCKKVVKAFEPAELLKWYEEHKSKAIGAKEMASMIGVDAIIAEDSTDVQDRPRDAKPKAPLGVDASEKTGLLP